MRKDDMTPASTLLEAVGIILGMVYCGLQIYYGITFHVSPFKYILNLLIMILVYAGLTILSNYPERINNIPTEICTGKIRSYSLWMIRIVKFVFIAGLLIPCVFDAAGRGIRSNYSIFVIGVILIVAVYCEYRIIQELKKMRNDK